MRQNKMTREELQQKLRELQTRKEKAICKHDENMLAIIETQQKTLGYIEDRKASFMQQYKTDRRNCDSAMRKATAEENTRYKLEKIAIANKERQLFADYKAQGEDEVSPDTEEA